MASEDFFAQLAEAWQAAGIPDFGYDLGRDEILALVDASEIIAHYITIGPLPDFRNIKLDVFLVGKDFLFNYSVSQAEATWGLLPASRISYIGQSFTSMGEERFFSLMLYSTGNPVQIIQDKIANKRLLLEFVSVIKAKVAESLKAI